jgi:hypothetical protein
VGVAMSCCPGLPQRWGWCCSARDGGAAAGMAAQADDDGGDVLHWSDVTASSRAGTG